MRHLSVLLVFLFMGTLTVVPSIAARADKASNDEKFDRLMSAFAAMKVNRARFKEERYVSFLDAPMTLEGYIVYRSPSFLLKITETPQFERLVLDGSELRIENESGVKVLSLHEVPSVQALVESVRATVSGEGNILERHYKVVFGGDLDRWHLQLTPRDAIALAFIRTVRMEGSGVRIRTIEILESGGDRSVIRMQPD